MFNEKMNTGERHTAEVFREAIIRYCSSTDRTLDDYFKSSSKDPTQQIPRIRKVLQVLERREVEEIVKLQLLGGITGYFEYSDDHDLEAVRHNFHNEGIMNHFMGHLFGENSACVFPRVINGDDFGDINTPYFRELQAKARKIFDTGARIRAEILRSDDIFRLHWHAGYLCILPSRIPFSPPLTPKNSVGMQECGIESDLVFLRDYYFQNPQKRLTLHDLIGDVRVRSLCPNVPLMEGQERYQAGMRPLNLQNRSDPSFDYDLDFLRKGTYVLKESDRFKEVNTLGQEMIKIYHSLVNIRNLIKENK